MFHLTEHFLFLKQLNPKNDENKFKFKRRSHESTFERLYDENLLLIIWSSISRNIQSYASYNYSRFSLAIDIDLQFFSIVAHNFNTNIQIHLKCMRTTQKLQKIIASNKAVNYTVNNVRALSRLKTSFKRLTQ